MSDLEQFSQSGNDDLAALTIHYGCDKHSHGYTHVYHSLFKNIRHLSQNILEVGIGTLIPDAHSTMVGYALDNYSQGGSLRVWRSYFPQARIHGFDIQEDTQFSEERIYTYLVNSTVVEEINIWKNEHPDLMFDVIVDDGSHIDDDQLATLNNLYSLLNPGGFYVIEDIFGDNRLLSTYADKIVEITGNAYHFFVLGKQDSHMLIISK
jgi:hypothetical protein